MASSRKSKILKLVNTHPMAVANKTITSERARALESLLKSFWFRLLLPKSWQSTICEVLVELRVSVLTRELLIDLAIEQQVILDTYKHNSVAQKEKTKKYSELRKETRANNTLIDNIPVHVDYSLLHEHEEGL